MGEGERRCIPRAVTAGREKPKGALFPRATSDNELEDIGGRPVTDAASDSALGETDGRHIRYAASDSELGEADGRFISRSVRQRAGRNRQETVQSRARMGAMVVYDGWTSTDAAVQELGYERPPPVRHEGNARRDKETGFHTNDAESENSRLKAWIRSRHGKLNIAPGDVDECIYYISMGSGVGKFLDGLAHSIDFAAKNQLFG
ncbi:unnamed protein product [Prorocentrum cordatum]|uniref:DDE domain-containing protein n=1 Tax=Prorocentrum cordatum TaxID=2364126 RepID=A0ABN9WVL4_9DINO|nr:unnamed protein product [Polarella glacialis]